MAFCWFSAAISDLIANIAGILYNILGDCPDRSDIFWLVPHPKKEENYMAFDGMVVANLTSDFSQKLTGGKISKIAQPEKDELLFTIKTTKKPIVYRFQPAPVCPLSILSENNKPSPLTAPNFCMLLL